MNGELLFVIVFLLLLFIVIGLLIKRFWIDKKSISLGTQFIAEHFWSEWQTKDKKRAIELVHFNKEQKIEEDDIGDDFSRFLKSQNKTRSMGLDLAVKNGEASTKAKRDKNKT